MFLKLFREGLLFAINSVVVNKLRTFLSLFGITIGIFCIISVFTVLDWLERSIRDSIDSWGVMFFISKIPWSMDGSFAYWYIIRWPTISLDDYQAVRSRCKKAAAVSLVVGQAEKVKYGNNIANDVVIAATTDNLEKVISLEVANGRYFSPFEFSGRSNVVVLGADIAENLFEDTDPVGKEVKIADGNV
jgi:putative ABC transport system permease protein